MTAWDFTATTKLLAIFVTRNGRNVLSLLPLLTCCATVAAETSKPNFLIIVTDDQD